MTDLPAIAYLESLPPETPITVSAEALLKLIRADRAWQEALVPPAIPMSYGGSG